MKILSRASPGNDKLNIGIIGCGKVVEQCHLPVLVSVPGTVIRWFCDSSRAKANRLVRTWNLGRAFEQVEECSDVDVVLIATPVGSRSEVLAKTTERGWHALCEKPFAPSASEHHRFLERPIRMGIKLGAGYIRRYWWSVERAREMLRTEVFGALKDIVAGDCAHLDRTGTDLSSYRSNATASGGGVLAETGCHLIDEVIAICDAIDVSVQECSRRWCNNFEVETDASGNVTLPSGQNIPLHFTVSGIRPVFAGIALRCERGEIRLRLDAAQGIDLIFGRLESQHILLPHPQPLDQAILAAFRSEWTHFIEAVNGNISWDMERATGLLTSEFITQCDEVAKGSLAVGRCR
jgi:predicted dehydrogenase